MHPPLVNFYPPPRGGIRRRWLVVACLLLGLAAAGCGGGHDPLAGYQDLSGVPLSASLRPYVKRGTAALSRPDPDNAVTRDLAAYSRLRAALERRDSRAAAVAEAVARHRRDPDAFIWVDLLFDTVWLHRREGLLDSLLAEPALADSTSPVGLYARAWQNLESGRDRGEGFRVVEPLRNRLDPLSRHLLELRLVEMESNTRGPAVAVARLLRDVDGALADGGCRLAARFWRSLARHLRRAGRLDDALHAVVLAQAMADHAGDRYGAFRIATTRLLILAGRGDRAVADTLLAACRRVARRENYPGALEDILLRQAEFLEQDGDLAAALQVRKQILSLSLANADSVNAPRDMWNVADDYLHLGNVDSAGVYVARARRWIARSGDRENRSIFPIFDAQYRYYVGEFAAAESLLNVARLEGGTVWEEAQLLHDLVRSALSLGNPAAAYRALARLRRLEPVLVDNRADQNFRADLALDTADLLARQGEFAAAAAELARADSLVQRPGAADRRWALHRGRGELALLRGDLATAEAELVRSRELAPTLRERREVSLLLGHVLLTRDRPAAARAVFATLAADSTRGVPFRTRLEAGLMLAACDERAGDLPAALAACRRALDRLPPRAPADLRLQAAVLHGRLLAAAGRAREAHAVLTSALSLVGRREGGGWSTDLLAYMQGTGRELAELLVGLEARHPDLAGGPAAVAEHTLSVSLAVRTALAAGAGDAGDRPPPRPGDLRRGDGPALVFQVGRRRSFAWVVDRGGVALAGGLPGRDALKRLLAPVLAGVAAPGRPLDTAALDTLARVLLAPLAGRWPAGRVLHLVPDDLLAAVPWPALPWPGGGTLLEHGPLCELPVVASRAAAATAAQRTRRLLALGWNDAPAPGVPVLRQAEREAARIADLWPGPVTLRTGRAAGWSDTLVSLLARSDVIHVASHLVLSQGLPSRGTLRLPGPGGGKPLTVAEAARLPLRADLVYLSCCEAAGGAGGRGVTDFADAFLAAGARTVVASSRMVDDAAAARVAEAFYRHWLAGKGRAAALRSALLELRGGDPRWRHPFYWSGYRLLGDGT